MAPTKRKSSMSPGSVGSGFVEDVDHGPKAKKKYGEATKFSVKRLSVQKPQIAESVTSDSFQCKKASDEQPEIQSEAQREPEVKKGRGRPRKDHDEVVASERPKRTIKPVKPIYDNKSLGHETRAKRKTRSWDRTVKFWGADEMTQLTELLKKHGSTKVIQEGLLPGRNVEEVRRLLASVSAPSRHKSKSVTSYSRKCNILESVVIKEQTDVKAPVTQWFEKILQNGFGLLNAKGLSKAFHFIAEFEDHPQPQGSGDVDYASIYHYFAELSTGAVPKDLNDASAAVVLELLRDLANLVVPSLDIGRERSKTIDKVEIWSIENVRNATMMDPSAEEKEEAKVVAGGKPKEIVSRLMCHPGLNPFYFQLHDLSDVDQSKAKLEDSEEEDRGEPFCKE